MLKNALIGGLLLLTLLAVAPTAQADPVTVGCSDTDPSDGYVACQFNVANKVRGCVWVDASLSRYCHP